MEFQNIGMQSVGRHKYQIIFVHYATFSYQIAPETLPYTGIGCGRDALALLYPIPIHNYIVVCSVCVLS